jgi:hypothetical protein
MRLRIDDLSSAEGVTEALRDRLHRPGCRAFPGYRLNRLEPTKRLLAANAAQP